MHHQVSALTSYDEKNESLKMLLIINDAATIHISVISIIIINIIIIYYNVGCVPKSLSGTKVLKMTTTGDTIITLEVNGTFIFLYIYPHQFLPD